MTPADLAARLVRRGALRTEGATLALRRHRIYGGGLDTILLELGLVEEPALWRELVEATGLPPLPPAMLEGPVIDPELLVDAATARRMGALPLVGRDAEGRVIEVIVRPGHDPGGLSAVLGVQRHRLYIVPEPRFVALLAAFYGDPVPPRILSLLGRLMGAEQVRRWAATEGTPTPPPPIVETGPAPERRRGGPEASPVGSAAPDRNTGMDRGGLRVGDGTPVALLEQLATGPSRPAEPAGTADRSGTGEPAPSPRAAPPAIAAPSPPALSPVPTEQTGTPDAATPTDTGEPATPTPRQGVAAPGHSGGRVAPVQTDDLVPGPLATASTGHADAPGAPHETAAARPDPAAPPPVLAGLHPALDAFETLAGTSQGPAAEERLRQAFAADEVVEALTQRRTRGEAADQAVLGLLGRGGTWSSDAVAALLASDAAEKRRWGAMTLASGSAAGFEPRLLELAHDHDQTVRAAALKALRNRMGSDPVKAFARGLRQTAGGADGPQALQAIGDLAALRDAEAVETLIGRVGGDQADVAGAARAALVSLTAHDHGPTRWRWNLWWRDMRHRHRVEWLMAALGSAREELRLTAFQELSELTGEYFGYAFDLDPRERHEARRRWQTWWQDQGRQRFGAG